VDGVDSRIELDQYPKGALLDGWSSCGAYLSNTQSAVVLETSHIQHHWHDNVNDEKIGSGSNIAVVERIY
jgi:hypothetical protein